MMLDDAQCKLFRTVVDIPPLAAPLCAGDGFVFLGSCFAQHVGGRFVEYGLPAVVNPLGALYNPASLALVLAQAVEPDVEATMAHHHGEWFSWLGSTLFSGPEREAVVAQTDAALAHLREALIGSKYLFCTLGTNVVYRLKDSGRIVTNCHRMPQQWFHEQALPLAQCTDCLMQIVDLARRLNPDIHVVFTLSPYRYAKYGFHRSQLSKAALLLAIEAIGPSAEYFPAYEIQLDELRDYRFYDSDMLHPAPQAVEYIWARLVEAWFSPLAKKYLEEMEPLRRALLHRPLKPTNPIVEQARLEALAQKVAQLQARYGIPKQ